MDRSRWIDLASGLLQVSGGALFVLVLQVGAFASTSSPQATGGLEGIIATLETAQASFGALPSPGLFPIEGRRKALDLLLAELDLPGGQENLDLGIGGRWKPGRRFEHFVGLGGTFPGLDSLSEAGSDADDAPMVFGAWVGAGSYWSPSPRIRLGLALKYTPARVSLDHREESPTEFHAVTGFAMRW